MHPLCGLTAQTSIVLGKACQPGNMELTVGETNLLFSIEHLMKKIQENQDTPHGEKDIHGVVGSGEVCGVSCLSKHWGRCWATGMNGRKMPD